MERSPNKAKHAAAQADDDPEEQRHVVAKRREPDQQPAGHRSADPAADRAFPGLLGAEAGPQLVAAQVDPMK